MTLKKAFTCLLWAAALFAALVWYASTHPEHEAPVARMSRST